MARPDGRAKFLRLDLLTGELKEQFTLIDPKPIRGEYFKHDGHFAMYYATREGIVFRCNGLVLPLTRDLSSVLEVVDGVQKFTLHRNGEVVYQCELAIGGNSSFWDRVIEFDFSFDPTFSFFDDLHYLIQHPEQWAEKAELLLCDNR